MLFALRLQLSFLLSFLLLALLPGSGAAWPKTPTGPVITTGPDSPARFPGQPEQRNCGQPWQDTHYAAYSGQLSQTAEVRKSDMIPGGDAWARPTQKPKRPRIILRKKGKINVAGAQLYYEETGRGTPVVLLHGHSFDRRMWDPQVAKLARHYRVIRYDLRGYGRSSLPVEGQPFLHAEDLYQLLRALQIPKAHVVGLSLGGFVAVDFMALHPENVLSVVSCSGSIYPRPGPEEPITETEIARRRTEIAQLQARGTADYKAQWLKSLLKSSGPDSARSAPLLRRMVQDWSMWQPLHVEPRVLLGRSLMPQLHAHPVQVPLLLLAGQRESAARQQDNETLSKLVPGARVAVVPDAGHVANLDNPAAFTQLVLRFLSAL